MFCLNCYLLEIWVLCMFHAIGSSTKEFEIVEDYPNSIDYNENFNRDRYDRHTKETDVMVKEETEEDEEQVDYSDYDAPEAAALMEVEEMEPEEKKGPTLGRVLGDVYSQGFTGSFQMLNEREN